MAHSQDCSGPLATEYSLLRTSSLRLQLRKEDHVANTFLPQQHHAESIDSHAHTARWRHPMFECDQKIFIDLLLLASGLMFEALALLDWIILLGVSRRDFLAVNAAFEDFHGGRI